VVAKISRDGLLINLWGNMRGFAPRSLLSTEPIEYPEKLFFVGQVEKWPKLFSSFLLLSPIFFLEKTQGIYFYVIYIAFSTNYVGEFSI
jgi:hypothetical protein